MFTLPQAALTRARSDLASAEEELAGVVANLHIIRADRDDAMR
jgi:hypothetical protein